MTEMWGDQENASAACATVSWTANTQHTHNTHALQHTRRTLRSTVGIPVPVIAAINGPAVGAGLCFALACDVRIAAPTAKLGLTFVGLGLHPGMGATHFLPSIAGPQVGVRAC